MTEERGKDRLLSVERLSVSFKGDDGLIPAVKDVSFQVADNEILCIVGESGSGKSVMAKSILRLLPSDSAVYSGGRIMFEGSDLLTMPYELLRKVRGWRISMIFQDSMSSLNPVYNVGRQMREVLRLHHPELGRGDLASMAEELLNVVEMRNPSRVLPLYPHQLSGGMRQRIMIAMALVSDARLLIADEPTTALDATIQSQILKLLMRLREERGIAIVLITHDLGVVHMTADRVIVFKDGLVEEEASKRALFAQPKTDYTKRLLNSMPRLTPRRDGDGI
ncbi:MAG: ABC transporter ATP-binding protein [Synergistaceae bacterium]|nr:ABC transporter ATP-binding protein [Synergistaceae bacterium]